MADLKDKKTVIFGSILTSILAAIITTLFIRARKRAKTDANFENDGKSQSTDVSIKSQIATLTRMLKESGITESQDIGESGANEPSGIKMAFSGCSKHDKEKSSLSLVGMRRPIDGVSEMLSDMQDEINNELLTNEGIAEIVLRLISLKNLIDPEERVDIRNIYFMNDDKQENMVIDLYTDAYGAPAYDEELARLWYEVFLVEDFWNADFSKVRVNVKDSVSENAIETVSCSTDNVRRYLLNDITEDQFISRCSHKKAKSRKSRAS